MKPSKFECFKKALMHALALPPYKLDAAEEGTTLSELEMVPGLDAQWLSEEFGIHLTPDELPTEMTLQKLQELIEEKQKEEKEGHAHAV